MLSRFEGRAGGRRPSFPPLYYQVRDSPIFQQDNIDARYYFFCKTFSEQHNCGDGELRSQSPSSSLRLSLILLCYARLAVYTVHAPSPLLSLCVICYYAARERGGDHFPFPLSQKASW